MEYNFRGSPAPRITWCTNPNDCGRSAQEAMEIIQYDVNVNVDVSYKPNKVTAQFFTPIITGSLMNFDGKSLSPQSIISYAMDLKNPDNNQYLENGLHPYISHYEMFLDQITVSTQKLSFADKPDAVFFKMTTEQRTALEDAFPSDLQSTLIVQNKVASAAGRGWMIGGIQKVFNATENKIVIEEADGGVASYNINNTITTLYNSAGQDVALHASTTRMRGEMRTLWPLYWQVARRLE